MIVALILAAVLLAAFVLWQTKGPSPLLPLRILRNGIAPGRF